MPRTWADPLMSRPKPVAGAIHERTVPGVPRLASHPHPSPDTKERAPMTATVIRPERTAVRARRRQSDPTPAQSHAT